MCDCGVMLGDNENTWPKSDNLCSSEQQTQLFAFPVGD